MTMHQKRPQSTGRGPFDTGPDREGHPAALVLNRRGIRAAARGSVANRCLLVGRKKS